MKRIRDFAPLLLAALLASCASGTVLRGQDYRADLDGDGVVETVRPVKLIGDPIAPPLMRVEIWKNGRRVGGALFPAWKIAVADINGDSVPEILIALSKVDYRDKQLRNRLYVYQWNGKFKDVWRGSRFPKAYVDFRVLRTPNGGRPELQLLEIDIAQRRLYLAEYKWLHFGFVEKGEHPVECRITIPKAGLASWYAPGAIDRCAKQ